MNSAMLNIPSFSEKALASLWMFIQLFAELALLFLAISFVVGLINQRLPTEVVQRVLGDKQGRGYLTAAGIGSLTPFCSCSSIPLLIGLLRAKAGFGPVMTFLFTSPLLNPIVVMLFLAVLGWKITLSYALLALFFSLSAGVLLSRFGFERYVKTELVGASSLDAKDDSCNAISGCGSNNKSMTDSNEQVCCDVPDVKGQIQLRKAEWALAWQESMGLFNTMMPYMVIAMAIGAIVHGFVPVDYFAKVASADNAAAVPIAATIGVPLYVRVSTLLPLVGSFMDKGVSIGAIIALVVGAGGASIPEFILLKRLFHWPLLLAFLAVIFSMAILGGYGFNLIFA